MDVLPDAAEPLEFFLAQRTVLERLKIGLELLLGFRCGENHIDSWMR